MGKKKEDHITNPQHLKDKAYHDRIPISKRLALYEFTLPHHVIEDEVLQLLQLAGDEHLLDVGCGEGKLLLKAAARYPKAHFLGVDLSSGMFGSAQQQAEKQRLQVKFRVEDAQRLSFRTATFDRVSAIHVIYHVPDMEKAISEMARVLKSGGLLALTANSLRSKETLRELKAKAGALMGIGEYPDTTLRFNIDTGRDLIERHFKQVELVPFESRLVLRDPQPYVDYFDSTRAFWNPYPTDEQWMESLTLVRDAIQGVIDQKGRFEEINLFGAFVASR